MDDGRRMRDERREMRDDRMIDEGLKTKRIGSVRELDVYRIKSFTQNHSCIL